MAGTNLEMDPSIGAECERLAKELLPEKAWEMVSTKIDYERRRNYEVYLPYFDATTYNDVYKAICGHSAYDCRTIDDFFRPGLTNIIGSFFGEEEASHIRAECELETEFPLHLFISRQPSSLYHPPYRSGHIRDYANIFFAVIEGAITFKLANLSLEEAMTMDAPSQRLSGRIALALRRSDSKIASLVRAAILGNNDTIQFSRRVILAIVKSGDPEALDMLGKLLLTANIQEGLRQAILETCYRGTISSFEYFIKLILNNDLCRFSSVIRAFDTWTSLGLISQKQKAAEKCMALALKYLADESLIRTGLDSNDAMEIYMSLWALACRDLYSATEHSRQLLGHPEKYKRLVGWYFVTHSNSDEYRHSIAIEHLNARDPEELAWACMNLDADLNTVYHEIYELNSGWDEIDESKLLAKTFPNENYPADAAVRAEVFDRIAEAAAFIGNKSIKFSESVFPWYSLSLTADKPYTCLILLALYDRSPDLIKLLAGHLHIMSVGLRIAYYSWLPDPKIPEQRTLLLNGLFDKSPNVKKTVLKRLKNYSLADNEVAILTGALTTSKAILRNAIMLLMNEQDEARIRPAVGVLLSSTNKNQLIAGVELLKTLIEKNPAAISDYRTRLSSLAADPELGQDVAILLNKIIDEEKAEYNVDNGYGLYNPAADVFNCGIWAKKRPEVTSMSDDELKSLLVPDENSLFDLFYRIADVFHRNRDYEYETDSGGSYGGARQKVLLGDNIYGIYPLAGKQSEIFGYPITDYPLSDKWIAAAGEYAVDKQKLIAVLALFADQLIFDREYAKWFTELFDGLPIGTSRNELRQKLGKHIDAKGVSFPKAFQILRAIDCTDRQNLFDFAFSIYVNLVNKIPPERLGDRHMEADARYGDQYDHYIHENEYVLAENYLAFWRSTAYNHIENDAQFSMWFSEMWYEYLAAGKKHYYRITDDGVYRAHHLGLITDDAIYAYLTAIDGAEYHIRNISAYAYGLSRQILEKYPAIKGIMYDTIDRVADIEENRGELPTDVTGIAMSIGPFEGGIRHFIKLLVALGDIGFHRGYMYYKKSATTKKESLSYLLRMCRPAPGDTPEDLIEAIKKAGISEKRLYQVAVYAPLWADMLELAMGIQGLKCGVWFFHAHVNEYFSVEKETETAVFSAISPQRFINGAFDKDWFFEAYNTLGEKKFNELYKNAKYITDSSIAHRRSQLYSDAVLGRMDKALIKSEIIEKRHQEKLRAYALIPLDDNNKNDASERYEFIRQFMKESRQFGAQRQANEVKACQIALENLAITTGYSDVDRMIWALEGAKIETDEKRLREQKRRARSSLETMMISRSPFYISELGTLLEHPTLQGMISDLVFIAGDALGFPDNADGKPALIDITGEAFIPSDGEKLFVAHPHDFVSSSRWSDYQRYLYQTQKKQPFKQIFREYYPITEDELAAVDLSLRYAGNQVQPKKAMALLKSRGWTADYYEGLQRVWHNEKLIARVYAMADWFSPSEIEAPAIEAIRFFSRDKMIPVPFTDISPIVFSETMRDIDLAVSVAHAGGVDPEASHSTMEMRIAIARELLAMLSVDNVTFLTAHAQVTGSFGEYSVHMGSGVVHKSGAGMISVVPVHSQARGRIFLPFADDDPKTAEIMSKILLFADDKKIKDPGILSQIR